MTAPYASLRDRTVSAVDARFGETVKIVFVKNGTADPTRPEITRSGVLRTAAQVAESMAGGRGQAWNVDIPAGSAILYLDRVRYPDLVLRKGDRVQAIARPRAPSFDIARTDISHHVRLIVHLTEG